MVYSDFIKHKQKDCDYIEKKCPLYCNFKGTKTDVEAHIKKFMCPKGRAQCPVCE